MAKGTVCLTFDFDAISLWVARHAVTASPVSRGEFGAVAVPRILHMLAKRGLPSTWFVPGHTVETYPDVCKTIVDAGHELGLHGYMHEDFSRLSIETERSVFQKSYEIMLSLTGWAPKGFRAPSWDFSANTVNLMMELGLLYDSSLMGNDYSPYYCTKPHHIPPDGSVQFGEKVPIVELPVSWSLDDYPHFEYVRTPSGTLPGLRDVEGVFRNWSMDLDYMLRDFTDGVLILTFHPQVIGRGHRLLRLERWIDELLGSGIEFSRMDIVAKAFVSGR